MVHYILGWVDHGPSDSNIDCFHLVCNVKNEKKKKIRLLAENATNETIKRKINKQKQITRNRKH